MKYKWRTYGYAWVTLPDGGVMGVHYRGTIEEAQHQLDKAAKECGGTAPDLKALREHDDEIMVEKIAARIFNEDFRTDT